MQSPKYVSCSKPRAIAQALKRALVPRSRRLAMATAFGLAAALQSASASAAIVQTIATNTVTPVPSAPLCDHTSLFDVATPGATYSLAPNTNLLPNGFDVHDLFGGTVGTNQYDSGVAIFADNQPKGTVSSVTVTLPEAVSLKWFNLFLEDDGPGGNRSASEFMLYAGPTLIDDVALLDNTGTQSYTGVYGNNFIELSGSLANAPVSNTYTLSFVQNQDASGASGVRATEFAAAVPEPGSATIMLLATGFLIKRKKRASVN